MVGLAWKLHFSLASRHWRFSHQSPGSLGIVTSKLFAVRRYALTPYRGCERVSDLLLTQITFFYPTHFRLEYGFMTSQRY